MKTVYKYELWNGREVTGYVSLSHPLRGTTAVFSEVPWDKRTPTKYSQEIIVPLIVRVVCDDPITFTSRRCLDVSRKSKRQIKILSRYKDDIT